jgi:hypothetical protein
MNDGVNDKSTLRETPDDLSDCGVQSWHMDHSAISTFTRKRLFNRKPLKTSATWHLIATHPSGQQEHISGFHTAAEALEWLSSKACAAWLRARGYSAGP